METTLLPSVVRTVSSLARELKNPRQRWLLKAPEHQVHLDTLLKVYPDARIVQTHRDPIKCMASTTSLMGTLYSMRSDQPFNAQLFDNIIMGDARWALYNYHNKIHIKLDELE